MIAPISARPFRPLFVACLALLTLAACDSGDPDEERIGISGQWSGVLTSRTDSTQAFPVEMTLNDNISTVTGSGSIELPDETLEFTVPSGLFAAPNIYLTLIYDRPPPGTISGNVSPNRDFIDASLTGPGMASGEVEFTLVLQRAE